MTDNEIIKALGHCYRDTYYTKCNSDCPLYDYCESDESEEKNICGLALDLINRQKSEIKRLNAKIMAKDNTNDYNTAQLRIAREKLKTAKSEAIKEFAERLKESKIKPEYPWDDYYINEGTIDALVKEMTEDNME